MLFAAFLIIGGVVIGTQVDKKPEHRELRVREERELVVKKTRKTYRLEDVEVSYED